MLPSLVDRYIFREWLQAFGLALGVTFGLLIMAEIYDQLGDLLALGATAGDAARYFAVLSPTLWPALIPISLLISVMLALGNLHRNSEIVALRAAGLGIFRITRTLWLAGVALTGLLFVLQAWVIPWAVEEGRAWESHLVLSHAARERGPAEAGVIHNLTFYDAAEGRLWFMNRFREYTLEGFGVTISELLPDGREHRRIAAREARFSPGRGWSFIDGREIHFDVDRAEAVRSLAFERLDRPDWLEDPDLMKALRKNPRDLSLAEVRKVLASVDADMDPRARGFLVQYHRALATPWTALVVIGIAIPFAVSGVRTNPLVGVSKAGGLFVAYYLLNLACFRLGEQGRLPALVAAWIPVGAGMLVALLAGVRR